MPRVLVSTPVRPTEDPQAVAQAATRFFPGTVEYDADGLRVVHDELETLRRRVWELRIIDTFRGALLAGLDGPEGARTGLRFVLSKQAAHAGRVSLPVAPHPLGELAVEVQLGPDDLWPDGDALVWWLCPETKDGQIVGPA